MDVITPAGTVRGRSHGGVTSFLGIPYAEPTGGARRFQPPEPRPAWTGILDATAPGPSCPQPPDWFSRPLPGHSNEPTDEDCLFLNVWTPSTTGRLPVLVWLHGGLFAVGSGSRPLYRGDRLAALHDVVVVTINHRLDALGYLALSGIAGDADPWVANVGMLDLVEALRWVRHAIAGFGGDPARVTVFGQSGGAGKASVLLAMPAATGLFHRVVLQSGARLSVTEPAAADRAARALLDRLGIDPADKATMRRAPVGAVVEAGAAVARAAGVRRGGAFLPVLDGTTVATHPVEAMRAIGPAGPHLVVGTTRHEATVLHVADQTGTPPGDRPSAGLRNFGDRTSIRDFGDGPPLGLLPDIDLPEAVADRYRQLYPGQTRNGTLVAAETFAWRRRQTLAAADAVAGGGGHVWLYRFDWPLPVVGATHGAELPFVFRRFDDLGFRPETSWEQLLFVASPSPEARQLASTVAGAWAAFATTGTPNAPGLPLWPRYENSSRTSMVFDATCTVVDDLDGPERHAWTDR